MNLILILYPAQFLCQTKFERKVLQILSNLDQFNLIGAADPNQFIQMCSKKMTGTPALTITDDWKQHQITHAIVFDDGEEFAEEIQYLRQSDIQLRWVKIAITRVVNVKTDPVWNAKKNRPGYEYIGRGGYWGNPYSMYGTGEDRDEVIRKFKYDFDHDKFPNKKKDEVFKLAGKRLGCFCKPLACHGDILADFLNRWDDGK